MFPAPTVVLPAYARHTRLDQGAGVMRLLADHAEIRAALQDFEQRRAKGLLIQAEAVTRKEAVLAIEQDGVARPFG